MLTYMVLRAGGSKIHEQSARRDGAKGGGWDFPEAGSVDFFGSFLQAGRPVKK